MTIEFDSFTNRGEYLSAHYFAEQLRADLTKGLFATWAMRESDEHHPDKTPRQRIRELRGTYLTPEYRSFFAQSVAREGEDDNGFRAHTYGNPGWIKQLKLWHRGILDVLGFRAGPEQLTVYRAGRATVIDVAWHGAGVVALDCGWASLTDAVLAPDGPGQLLHPLRVSASESHDTGTALASWLFQSEMGEPGGDPPRFVLLLCGGIVLLADRRTWAEGRFLAVDLDTALERNNRTQTGELAIIAALFCHETLAPTDGKDPRLDTILRASTDNAVGVSTKLREGLQRSVEIIANEVLARLDSAAIDPRDIEDPRIQFARELTRETLRYLYRILFLLYAEARPELGILPADDGSYEAGYSVARLRDLVERDEQLVEEEARSGFHLFASLDLLFDKVNNGHRPWGTEPDDDHPDDDEDTRAAKARVRSEDRGLRFEPLRSELFEPKSIRLIGMAVPKPHTGEDGPRLDLRLRNAALHEVLRLLMMKKGSRRGARGGFISYRNLGINQLGAVYEGLMSYTGIIAGEELCEVAKRGEPEKGSWLIPAHRQTDYPENTLVTYDEHDNQRGLRGPKRYRRGTFVYRLAGRDRETSASYYTPESLTKVTVELTLKHRLDQQRNADGAVVRTRAAEVLRWTICEPALGSGAFANEAINQVAEEYLRRRQDELGISIPAADALAEKQRVKAYIALHNTYGVDLNATGVELAEVSLWLNTMHPGMQAPWFGLHLRRGNSLIGGRRAVYVETDVTSPAKAWLRAKGTKTTEGGLPPRPLPFPAPFPDGAVHQFLLPSPGWAAVTGSKEAVSLTTEPPNDPIGALATWKKGVLTRPKKAQYIRVRDAARRVEFLWALVARRMEISEGAIARRIPVWGTDPADPEFAFLHRSEQPVAKEQVFADLFHAVDTPYWRLKTVMDAWCALWFWPTGRTDLLDGTHPTYSDRPAEQSPAVLRALLGELTGHAAPEQSIVQELPVLFTVGGEQLTLDEAEPVVVETTPARKVTPTRKARPARRPVIPLVDLDDWLEFLESMLGTEDVPDGSLISQFETLEQLKDYEDQLPGWMGMDSGDPEQRFPWLHEVREIADAQGFLHWELEFARVFARDGGFDLQVGNPPWVRPEWKEDPVLAESEPWFMLTEKPNAAVKARRRATELDRPGVLDYVVGELTTTTTLAEFLSSAQVYPLISGGRPDLYRAFMCTTWAHSAPHGCIGLLHPDTHFNGDNEAHLREAAYRRLRVHADFVNAGNRFFPPPIGRSSHFGLHIYGDEREISFDHLSWLFSIESLRLSATHIGPTDETVPRIRFEGSWDERPHQQRIVRVTAQTLARWQRLSSEEDLPVEHARLLSPVSTAEDPAIEALTSYPVRLAAFKSQITDGLNETNAKKTINGPNKNVRLIDYNRDREGRDDYQAASWSEVILKGPQLGVANPLFKQPSQGAGEMRGLNLKAILEDAVPESEYYQVADDDTYRAAQDMWLDHVELARRRSSDDELVRTREELAVQLKVPAAQVTDTMIDSVFIDRSTKPNTTFYRLSWREMIAPDTERSLYAAIIPPAATHIHAVRSAALSDATSTCLVAGFWASLPIDYLLRTTGVGHLDSARARRLPAPHTQHPLARALLLRILRLNCLTAAYAPLWSELYDPVWEHEGWAIDWAGLGALNDLTPDWRFTTPLRSERARRSALVEIDALVAVWLGIPAGTLAAMYGARFPIMQDFDEVTWFDAAERKIAGDRYTYGHGQTKEHWAQFQEHLADPAFVPAPEGYTPPFFKADREGEMREAHAVFQARLDAAVARGEWDPVAQERPLS
jgi:hypothetical protein